MALMKTQGFGGKQGVRQQPPRVAAGAAGGKAGKLDTTRSCINCGSKQHLHVNCPHDDNGVSKPGSHGSGKSNGKGKGKGKGKYGGRGGDQANTIEPAAKKTKKARAAELDKVAIALEKRMTKNLTKAVAANLSSMDAEVTESVSGNVQGATASLGAAPATTGNTRRRTIQFRLPAAE